MASRYQIQMDFNKAAQKANELDGIADNLSRLADTDLQNTLDGLNNDWKGDNAGEYIKKGFALKENMDKTVKDIRSTAGTIRTVAKNIYDAEMEALRIAEEREAAARAAAAAAAKAAEEARNAGISHARPSGGGGGRRF